MCACACVCVCVRVCHACIQMSGLNVLFVTVQIDETADIYGFVAETVGAVWT